ncbi:MAG: hypothetical protein AAGC71_02930, partial [Pseudomonadota bacterium]
MPLIAEAGYWIAAVSFLALAGVLLLNFRQGRVSVAALLFAGVSALFAVVIALSLRLVDVEPINLVLLDIARLAAWMMFVTLILLTAERPPVITGLLWFGNASWVALLALVLFPADTTWLRNISAGLIDVRVIQLLAALAIMLFVEQIFRNSREKEKTGVRFLCVGLGIPAAFDLCLAAHAVLFSVPSPLLEAPRGFFLALAPPLVAIGLQRSAILNVGVFVSRQIIFYTTSVLGAGIYLLAMAAVGFWLQSLQLVWGPLLQAIFFIAALALLVWALFSDSLRSTVKVWVSKHFYENKYDYREEWAL